MADFKFQLDDPFVKDPPSPLEQKIGELYAEFFKLREAAKYQEEYDAMGALLNMLMQDRDHLRKKHSVKP